MTSRVPPRTRRATVCSLVRIDGYEFDAEFLDLLDEPEQMRLIGHLAGQHRHARQPLQPHAFKQEPERIAQLPAKDEPVPAALRPVAVHFYEPHTQAGDPSSPSGRIHLGEAAGQARPGPQVRAPAQSPPTRQADLGDAGRRRPVPYPLECSLEEAELAAAFERAGP